MRRQSKRWMGMRALLMVLAGLAGAERLAKAQSELGRGSGGGVAYPYGPSSSGGRAGLYNNSNNPVAGGTGGPASPTGLIANPSAVPSMNPFLNPYASMYASSSPSNAALYFVAAQQGLGGIGSGQLSGTRPRPGAAAAVAPSPIPSDRRVSDTPGAGAARYFNRAVKGGGVPDQHYNRFGNYYSANGH